MGRTVREMTMRTRFLLMSAALFLAGCQDTIVKALDLEDNNVQVTVEPDYVRIYADDMDNVHGTYTIPFTFSDTMAAVIHRNFVHHGQVRFNITDSRGSVVYGSNAEWNLDLQTYNKAEPGPWTLYVGFFGARGRVDLRIQKLGTPIEE
jgi:hypothetical protein